MKDDDFKLLGVLLHDRQTDICDCRVAFATEKVHFVNYCIYLQYVVLN